jgi:hypothetical protein
MKRVHRRKRIARLTPKEDHAWVFAFCYYVDQGKMDLQADKLAWRDLRLGFPRLNNFDGCD